MKDVYSLAELVAQYSPNPWHDVLRLRAWGDEVAARALERAALFRERTNEVGSFGDAMESDLARELEVVQDERRDDAA